MRKAVTTGVQYRSALKMMPPHSGKQAIARSRLVKRLLEAADGPLSALIAQAGFGKTSLLVQLRRELLARGGSVAWLSSDAADAAANFIPALVTSVRVAIGLDVPARSLDHIGQAGADLSVAGELLVQIHNLACPTYLFIDDLHLIADEHVVEFIYYLITNAPPNFHVVVASRVDLPFPVQDLRAHGLYAQFVTDDLRLRLDETIIFLRSRFDNSIDIETCVRLHERTEGWPMVLQIITAAIDKDSNIAETVAGLSGATGDIARYFHQFVLQRLKPAEVTMLIRASILTTLRPELCALLGGIQDCSEILRALEHDTGLVVSVEGGSDIYRMHPLLTEYLRDRAKELPAAELQDLHRIAAEWYASKDQLEEAAEHAFVAGMRSQAMDWIEKRLRYLGVQGRIVEVLAWLDRLPPEEVTRREGIQLTAAWACTLCFRLEDAKRLTAVILAQPDVTSEIVMQANIIRSAIAIHCDDYESARRYIESYDHTLGPLYCNSFSYIAIHSGLPEKARYYQQISDGRGKLKRSFYDAMYGAFAVGLSYLVEGQAPEAARVFRVALERAELNSGRRSLPAAMQAAGLAASCWELGAEDEARSLLANRLDLIEQAALPDAVIFAYLTLARYEIQAKREGKALDALNSLAEIGRSRGQPRLVAISLAEQVRQHAIRNRLETCRTLMDGLDTLVAQNEQHLHGLDAELRLVREIAAARVALIDFRIDTARIALERARELAGRLRRGRDLITIKILSACCAPCTEKAALSLLAEAMSLAESFKLVRAIADDWPAALDYLPHMNSSGAAKAAGLSPAFVELVMLRGRAGDNSAPSESRQSGMKSNLNHLSEREMEILDALARGRSNKEIARLLGVGAETIKWHLKNLFSKLNTVNRRHAVDRARLLGIID
jgi:LuxR family transcriptional regulator, maltose regulon positive regulatory protein